MYTVAKGQTNLLQKSRRGLGIEGQKSGSPPPTDNNLKEESMVPSVVGTLVFNAPQTLDRRARKREARRSKDKASSQEKDDFQQMVEEHRQLVSFLSKSWSQIRRDIDADCGGVKYHEDSFNPELSDFEPFNLDLWMEKKIYDAVMAGI